MKRNTLTLLGISLAISIIGFIVDLHERVENIYTNIFEVVMMTLLIFLFLFAIIKTVGFISNTFMSIIRLKK